MSYSTVTAVTNAVIPAADINKLMENIDLVKGGVAGTAPSTTVEALSTGKMAKITPADGVLLQSDENGQAESSGKATADIVTASANFATDEILLGAGADKTAKKSGKSIETTLTETSDLKVPTSKASATYANATHEVFISSAFGAGAQLTRASTAYGDFSTPITITFTPTKTGKYKVWCVLPVYNSSSADMFLYFIKTSGGASAVIDFAQVIRVYYNSSNFTVQSPMPYTIVSCVAGESITFNLYGKISSGTAIVASDTIPNGFVVVAERIG